MRVVFFFGQGLLIDLGRLKNPIRTADMISLDVLLF